MQPTLNVEPTSKSFTSKHSYYQLPKITKTGSQYQFKKNLITKTYEFIGLATHMPFDIRNQLTAIYDSSSILKILVKWDNITYSWKIVSEKSISKSPLVKYEINVTAIKKHIPVFRFELQLDYSFKFMHHQLNDGNVLTLSSNRIITHAYRHRSLELCLEKAIALDCQLEDIVEYQTGIIDQLSTVNENTGVIDPTLGKEEIMIMKKQDLISWLRTLIVENEIILKDEDERQAVQIKFQGHKYFITKKEQRLFNQFQLG